MVAKNRTSLVSLDFTGTTDRKRKVEREGVSEEEGSVFPLWGWIALLVILVFHVGVLIYLMSLTW